MLDSGAESKGFALFVTALEEMVLGFRFPVTEATHWRFGRVDKIETVSNREFIKHDLRDENVARLLELLFCMFQTDPCNLFKHAWIPCILFVKILFGSGSSVAFEDNLRKVRRNILATADGAPFFTRENSR